VRHWAGRSSAITRVGMLVAGTIACVGMFSGETVGWWACWPPTDNVAAYIAAYITAYVG
jgi:hypothetical protein